jgi:hypothetical protein
MSHAVANRWVVGLVLCVPVLTACSKDPCFPASKGKQYQINIVELWDANSQFPGGQTQPFPCPVDFDLKAGGSFVVQVDGFDPDSVGCTCGTGHAIQGPDGWTWSGVRGATCGANFFELRTTATNGDCTGDVQVSIEASRVPTGSEVPGQPPVAHLKRSFQESAPTCNLSGGTCTDRFVVEIVEL